MADKNSYFTNLSREQRRIEVKSVPDGLAKLADFVINQAFGWLDKNPPSANSQEFRAFGEWHTGYNFFTLEIFGLPLDQNAVIVENPDFPDQDFNHYRENLNTINEKLIAWLIGECQRQNILGMGFRTTLSGEVGILDRNFILISVWNAYPSGSANAIDPRAAAASQN